MTLPKNRKKAYQPHPSRRKANYPDDETLIAWVNATSLTIVARMLGVSKMALSYYVRSTGLDRYMVFRRRRNYLAVRRKEALKLARMMFRLDDDSDTHNMEEPHAPDRDDGYRDNTCGPGKRSV